jgi:hypothetical protein
MSGTLWAILCGGGACAVLDGTAATVQFGLKGIKPLRVWQGVASGALGESAFSKGWVSGGLGLLVHCIVALTVATVFVEAAFRAPILARNYWFTGPAYGVLVFLAMNLIVVPLSARPKRPRSWPDIIAQIMIHIVFVGLPIAMAASRFMLSE